MERRQLGFDRRATATLMAAVVAFAWWVTGTPRGEATVTLQPVDDAQVAARAPDANYGSGPTLESDGSPVLVGYLKFDLRAVNQPIQRATLRMHKTNGSKGLQTLSRVENDSWSEATLTYRNRPSLTASTASFVPGASTGSSVTVDVSAAVAGELGTLLSLAVHSTSSDGFAFSSGEAASNQVALVLEFADQPPGPTTTLPASSTTTTTTVAVLPPPGSDPVVAAAGDIACPGVCGQDETAALLDTINPVAILGLGDYQYEYDTLANLATYYEPYWGRFKTRTYPAPGGSHDFYGTGDYLTYFNAGGPVVLQPEGSYSYNLGAWHIVSLNSYCFERSSCDETAVTNWLIADLAANPTACTLAYFHQPYWTSPSNHNRTVATKPWIQVLYDAGADVVLQAHNHVYERFAPQTPDDGRDDARGLTAFTVGTGGRSHYTFKGIVANSLARDAGTFGVLELTLHANGYDFRFVPEPGKAFTDSGSASCH